MDRYTPTWIACSTWPRTCAATRGGRRSLPAPRTISGRSTNCRRVLEPRKFFSSLALDRLLALATTRRGSARGKAVFACSAHNFWKEYELPPRLGATQIFLQPRFQLKPLAALLGAQPALCVAMVDRQRARVFDLRLDDLHERGAIVHMLSRNAASYGYNGYEGGHAERRVSEEALQHFKAVAERLRTDFEKGIWERLIVGCQDATGPEFESHLHPYVK